MHHPFFLDNIVCSTTERIIKNTPIQKEKFSSCPSSNMIIAINAERDKQNNGIRASVNKTYTYYMQQLNRLIIENKALQNENDTLKAENTEVNQRISQLDENTVRRVTVQKDAVIESLNTQLVSKNEDITMRGDL